MPIDPRMPSEMTLEWKPDLKILRTYALHQGVALDLFTDHALKAFTGYYEPKGQTNTEAEWVSMLVKWVRNDLNRNSNVKTFAPRQASQDFDDDDTGWNEQGSPNEKRLGRDDWALGEGPVGPVHRKGTDSATGGSGRT